MKKKVVSIMLVACMAVGLAACESSGSSSSADATDDTATTEESSAAEESSVVEESAEEESAASDVSFDEAIEITFATSGKSGSLSATMYEEWMELVEEDSGGQITFDYQSEGVLGSESEALQQIMDGVIEAGVAGIANYTNYNTIAEVYQLPFLIDSYETEWTVLQSDEWQAIMDDLESSIGSLYIYGAVDVGMRHIATVDTPITCLDDIQGLKIRTASSEVLIEALELLGANPIVVEYNEVYSSLSNGIVDGEDVNYMSAVTQSHYEVVNYMTEIGMYPYPSFVCFNRDFIDSLPEGYWDFMQDCMDEAMENFFTNTIVNADAEYRETMEENGVTVYELDDLDAWREAIQPLYDEYTAEGTDQLIIDFINYVEEVKAAE